MRILSSLILMLVACGGTDPQTTEGTQTTDTGKTDTGDASTAGTAAITTGGTTDGSGGATGTGTSTGPVEPTGGDSTSTGATTTDASTSSATTDASTTDAGSTSTTDASSTTGGPTGMTLSLEDVLIYANCQPIVEADPLHGQWTTVFDNSLGAADMATLAAVSFMINEGDPPIAVPWQATPNMSGPIAAGAKLSQPVMKIKGSPYPACASCGKPFTLTVTYTLGGGADVFAQADGNLECVF
jgi:hypothetical protein